MGVGRPNIFGGIDKGIIMEFLKRYPDPRFINFCDYNPTVEDLISGKVFCKMIYINAVGKAIKSIN